MSNIVLETKELTKTFGTLTAVNKLSLQVNEGEVFGFLGPNGAGKTTSINMICGLLAPTSGEVKLKGVPLVNGNRDQRRVVGMCPQSIVLWERLTCIEQLEFMGQMYDLTAAQAREAGRRLLNELGLEDKSNSLARTLSGGMQRRLNLAMALVHDPELVVLDEPEAGLDPQSRVKVREYIQSLARKKTVIITTHNMDEAERVADRIAIIDHGELLVQDTPERLKQSLGEGDQVDIHLDNGTHDPAEAQAALSRLTSHVKYDSESQHLKIRALNAVGNLAEILEALRNAGFKPGEVNIHANTLEDVFIQLTGRRLRE
ncbi:MAG: ABC transporter ATP-binding protein [Chloroflexi bacterium]|jgi:ABC-2 type transport system ATP-binding protein|nr:ABC transporter ATP-binding protein [Chloroflexota bacterium]BCY16774.1 antibiotic ABC transporter ATP-binding protein [Leptolinea sp. HRD-7]